MLFFKDRFTTFAMTFTNSSLCERNKNKKEVVFANEVKQTVENS
jgi:hypothetical protein